MAARRTNGGRQVSPPGAGRRLCPRHRCARRRPRRTMARGRIRPWRVRRAVGRLLWRAPAAVPHGREPSAWMVRVGRSLPVGAGRLRRLRAGRRPPRSGALRRRARRIPGAVRVAGQGRRSSRPGGRVWSWNVGSGWNLRGRAAGARRAAVGRSAAPRISRMAHHRHRTPSARRRLAPCAAPGPLGAGAWASATAPPGETDRDSPTEIVRPRHSGHGDNSPRGTPTARWPADRRALAWVFEHRKSPGSRNTPTSSENHSRRALVSCARCSASYRSLSSGCCVAGLLLRIAPTRQIKSRSARVPLVALVRTTSDLQYLHSYCSL